MSEKTDSLSLPLPDSEKRAGEIYKELRLYADLREGFTTLNSLRRATTFYPDNELLYEISSLYPKRPEEIAQFINYGFSEEDIVDGVSMVKGHVMSVRDALRPFGTYQKGDVVTQVYIIDRNGKFRVVKVSKAGAKERELDTKEALALGTRGVLVEIVKSIGDTYGDFAAFKENLQKSVQHPNFMGINYVQETGGILYNGGLTAFVEAYQNSKSQIPADNSAEQVIRS
jgi:hypothetical protein